MKIGCCCGDESCTQKIVFEFTSGQALLTWTDKNGEEHLLYLDANGVVKMIHGLKDGLLNMTRTEDGT